MEKKETKTPEYKHIPHAVWLCGEAKAGKSTTAYNLLQKKLRAYIVVDGDSFRRFASNTTLTFSRKDIIENNRRCLKMVRKLLDEGWDVLIPQITPYAEMREEIKKALGDQVLIVQLEASERCREQRLNYRKSAIAFEPGNVDLVLDSEKYSQDYIRDTILDEMIARGWVPK